MRIEDFREAFDGCCTAVTKDNIFIFFVCDKEDGYCIQELTDKRKQSLYVLIGESRYANIEFVSDGVVLLRLGIKTNVEADEFFRPLQPRASVEELEQRINKMHSKAVSNNGGIDLFWDAFRDVNPLSDLEIGEAFSSVVEELPKKEIYTISNIYKWSELKPAFLEMKDIWRVGEYEISPPDSDIDIGFAEVVIDNSNRTTYSFNRTQLLRIAKLINMIDGVSFEIESWRGLTKFSTTFFVGD